MISERVMMLFTKRYQNKSMLVENTALPILARSLRLLTLRLRLGVKLKYLLDELPSTVIG